MIRQAIADTEKGKDDFDKFLQKTMTATGLRMSGLAAMVPEALNGARGLAKNPGRCNMLTGLSCQWSAIGRYADAVAAVQDCNDGGSQNLACLGKFLHNSGVRQRAECAVPRAVQTLRGNVELESQLQARRHLWLFLTNQQVGIAIFLLIYRLRYNRL